MCLKTVRAMSFQEEDIHPYLLVNGAQEMVEPIAKRRWEHMLGHPYNT